LSVEDWIDLLAASWVTDAFGGDPRCALPLQYKAGAYA
jgi:hypothetical protein